MQIKIFAIPAVGGERANDEMNAFLRSKQVLEEDHFLQDTASGPMWCILVKYLDGGEASKAGQGERIDYREVLDEASFQRFSIFREIRKKIAEEDGLKVFQVFTNWELAELAKLEQLTIEGMKAVKGIGEKKVERPSRCDPETVVLPVQRAKAAGNLRRHTRQL